MPRFSKKLRLIFVEAENFFLPLGFILSLWNCSIVLGQPDYTVPWDPEAQSGAPGSISPSLPCAFGKMLSRTASLRLQPDAAKARISACAGNHLDFGQ